MASESLIGGGVTLSPTTIAILDSILGDTVNGNVTITEVGGARLVKGTGSGGTTQGALIPAATTVSGVINAGVVNITVALPANMGVAFEGPSTTVTASGVTTFLTNVINTNLPQASTDPGVIAYRNAVVQAATEVVASLSGGGGSTPVAITFVRLVENTTSAANVADPAANAAVAGTVVFEATPAGGGAGGAAGSGNEVFALDISQVSAGKTVVLKGVERALVTGAGTVQAESSSGPVYLHGETRSQVLIGAAGADTLVGGGGSDTLVGGAGRDILGFSAHGNYVLSDFKPGEDILAFQFSGLNSTTQLVAAITGIDTVGNNYVVHFGPNSSITLVGVNPAQITADMIHFTLS